jgi:sugar porter (SP) family MFS transporter
MKSRFVLMMASVAALGGLLFGYDTGVISGAIIFIEKTFTLSTHDQEIVVSVVLIGAMIGAMIAGAAADRFGRRRTLIAAGVVFGISSILSALARDVTSLEAARFAVGLAIGVSSVTAPLYISEVSPRTARGALVSLYQFAITIGIVVAQLVNYAFAPSEAWDWMLGLAIVPSVLLVAGMLAMPESPRWLIGRGRADEARETLVKTRGANEVDESVREIEATLQTGEGSWKELVSPRVRGVLFVGVALAVLQQVTGINTVIYYGPKIFQSAGFSSAQTAILATLGVGIVNVLMTIVAIVFIDRLGRKPLLYAGVAGMGLALAALAWAFSTDHAGGVLGTITIAGLMFYVGCFAFSLGPIVWLLISEIYPLRVRGRGMAIATFANWLANFIVSLYFLTMINSWGSSATFGFYATMCVLTLVFIRFFVPETKGEELESISLRRARPERTLTEAPARSA